MTLVSLNSKHTLSRVSQVLYLNARHDFPPNFECQQLTVALLSVDVSVVLCLSVLQYNSKVDSFSLQVIKIQMGINRCEITFRLDRVCQHFLIL